MTRAATQKTTPVKAAQSRLRTLGEEAKSPEAKVDVLGVILDCTGHYRTNNSYDYITKIKLIDKTHHPHEGGFKRVEGAITAYVFSEKASDAPVVVKIGDVLLLRQTSFATFRNRVTCKVWKNICQWAVFDGRLNAPKTPSSASANFTGLRREEHAPLMQLRGWAVHFFINNSLFGLDWYRSQWPADAAPDKTYELKDVDIIVKVLGSVQLVVEGQRYQKIAFGDAEHRFYFSELSQSHVELEADMVVKLRSVCIIRAGESMRIDFYNYSSILLLLDSFKDAKTLTAGLAQVNFDEREIESQFFEEFHLDKHRKRAVSNNVFVYEHELSAKKTDLVALFPILAEFAAEPAAREEQPGTYVKSAHAALPFSTLKELGDANAATQKRSPSAPAVQKLYRVRARLAGVEHTELAKIARFYSRAAGQTWPITDRGESTKHKDTVVIFHAVFQLNSDAIGARTLQCYLSTIDGNPAYFFDLWKLLPDVYNADQWRNLKPAVAKEFAKKLESFVSQKCDCQFVLLQQRDEKGKHFFRIVDTIMGFYR